MAKMAEEINEFDLKRRIFSIFRTLETDGFQGFHDGLANPIFPIFSNSFAIW